MKEYTIKFVTTDEFDPVVVEWGRKHQKDGVSYLKLILQKYITALVGGKHIQDFSISYKTLKKAKNV